MRASAAILAGTPVRLSDLRFPCERALIQRTRLAYIHLDNLLNFAKIDRDGRVNGYLAAYLPNELALIFFRAGEAITAVALTDRERSTITIDSALTAMRTESERGELAFSAAPLELLSWMYYAGSAPPRMVPVDRRRPAAVFEALQAEKFTGVLEFIVEGVVSYIALREGRFHTGHFADRPEGVSVPQWIEHLLEPHDDGSPRAVSAAVFTAVSDTIPEQASPALLQAAREVFWRLAEHVEREAPGDGLRRAQRLRDTVAATHASLSTVSVPRNDELHPQVITPEEMTAGLAEWTRQLLEQVEVVAPGAAPAVLKAATKDHRFVLQRAGFYARLPWTVTW
jgi:hypothetical protein